MASVLSHRQPDSGVLFCHLFWFFVDLGPLSDRYGRRPPLLAELGLYVGASLFCAVADNVVVMIFARTLQGGGAVAASELPLLFVRIF